MDLTAEQRLNSKGLERLERLERLVAVGRWDIARRNRTGTALPVLHHSCQNTNHHTRATTLGVLHRHATTSYAARQRRQKHHCLLAALHRTGTAEGLRTVPLYSCGPYIRTNPPSTCLVSSTQSPGSTMLTALYKTLLSTTVSPRAKSNLYRSVPTPNFPTL